MEISHITFENERLRLIDFHKKNITELENKILNKQENFIDLNKKLLIKKSNNLNLIFSMCEILNDIKILENQHIRIYRKLLEITTV
jgi:hypothetical protein